MSKLVIRRIHGGFTILYWIMLVIFFIRPPYTYTSFPQPAYGAKIEGNHYYLRIDKTLQKYEEVTRQQYEEVDRATTNFAIGISIGMLGFSGLCYLGKKLEPSEVETANEVFVK